MFHRRTLTAALAMILIAGLAYAAPIRPSKPRLPDEQRCLANIKTVAVEVDILPRDVVAAGVTKDDLRKIMVATLEENGFQVTTEPVTPRLVLKILTLREDDRDDVMSLVLFLDIQQRVKLYRLDEDMILPTATVPAWQQFDPKELGVVIKDRTQYASSLLVQVVKMAANERIEEAGKTPK